jgi:hypothetical protein
MEAIFFIHNDGTDPFEPQSPIFFPSSLSFCQLSFQALNLSFSEVDCGIMAYFLQRFTEQLPQYKPELCESDQPHKYQALVRLTLRTETFF